MKTGAPAPADPMSNQILVPYITTWSTEQPLPTTVIQRPRSGIAYADEILNDRDEHGVLWTRTPSRPGHGRPRLGKVHPLRQRRAMRRLLCQVCAGPADRTDNGILWVLQDHRDDWPHWPNRMAATEPPICAPCAHTASRACPALRKGHVTIRVGHSHLAGIYGALYQPGPQFPTPATDALVAFDDPAIHWSRATQLAPRTPRLHHGEPRQLRVLVIPPRTPVSRTNIGHRVVQDAG